MEPLYFYRISFFFWGFQWSCFFLLAKCITTSSVSDIGGDTSSTFASYDYENMISSSKRMSGNAVLAVERQAVLKKRQDTEIRIHTLLRI